MKRVIHCILVTGLLSTLVGACDPTAEEAFKNALPHERDLKVVMGSGDSGEQALRMKIDCPECCVDDVDGNYIDSEIYKMTRGAIHNVNGTLVTVYVWLNFIVQLPYSEQIENGYIWGPWDNTDGDPLSRLEYRFVMVEKEDETFDYQLEAKLIADDQGEWTPYLFGNVKPSETPHRGIGTMKIDFDLLFEMDSAFPSPFHGQVSYAFDVRQAFPSADAPNTVTVNFVDFWEDQPGQEPETFSGEYRYERYDNLAGKFAFVAHGDFTGPDDSPDGVDETFNVTSRWNQHGKGLGQAQVSGGSLDAQNVTSYAMTECWADADANYYETYNHEKLTFSDGTPPLEETRCGEPAHCPTF